MLKFLIGTLTLTVIPRLESRSTDCVDNLYTHKSELCYECIDCRESNRLLYSQECESCVDSIGLYDCRGCTNCIGCVGLRQQSYQIFNQPVSKKE